MAAWGGLGLNSVLRRRSRRSLNVPGTSASRLGSLRLRNPFAPMLSQAFQVSEIEQGKLRLLLARPAFREIVCGSEKLLVAVLRSHVSNSSRLTVAMRWWQQIGTEVTELAAIQTGKSWFGWRSLQKRQTAAQQAQNRQHSSRLATWLFFVRSTADRGSREQ